MNKKKILTIILTLGVVAITGFGIRDYSTLAKSQENIKVMAYTSPTITGKTPLTITGENGYQIGKYKNIENNQWLGENEVLSLTKKSDFKNPDSKISVRYCSIYNLNTNESKDFKDPNIDEFLGVSPDKKYVLYAEPRVIPKIGSDEWQKALDSGDLLHKNVKLLNLSTGEIADVNTEKVNSDAQFKWIGNSKILANYFDHWAIIDTTGKVYANGNYNGGKHEDAWIAGTDDIKDLGDSVEGKFYYTQDVNGNNGGRISTKMCSIDIKTKEIKTLRTSKNSISGSEKGNTIVMDNSNDNGEAVDGVFLNRTFGEVIMDKSGNVIRSIDLPKGINHSEYILSPDGNKAAYLEYANEITPINSEKKSNNNNDIEQYLKVIDIKTGDVKEIVKSSSLKDENEEVEYDTFTMEDKDGKTIEKKVQKRKGISNICWGSTGEDLSFTYGNSSVNNSHINTYIVNFDE